VYSFKGMVSLNMKMYCVCGSGIPYTVGTRIIPTRILKPDIFDLVGNFFCPKIILYFFLEITLMH